MLEVLRGRGRVVEWEGERKQGRERERVFAFRPDGVGSFPSPHPTLPQCCLVSDAWRANLVTYKTPGFILFIKGGLESGHQLALWH